MYDVQRCANLPECRVHIRMQRVDELLGIESAITRDADDAAQTLDARQIAGKLIAHLPPRRTTREHHTAAVHARARVFA